MGLDMHLTGSQYLRQDYQNATNDIIEEGYRLKAKLYDLGYWRKHPDLHGFIVENFSHGNDDCNPVYLNSADIKTIINAIQDNKLPPTVGFFFGESANDDEEKAEAIEILSNAARWLDAGDWTRSVYYQASW